ncbi:HAD-IC family P-type ATPase [Micromonospora sp. DT227]|uniref:HAD-IC family P-type ATPase n=1 Tax=Micromonospora sp. DT227 TaxID=3393433 RepID=UPI003CE71744
MSLGVPLITTSPGEPLPAVKSVGDEVFAGTLNGTGTLVVQVHREAGESVIARIVALVEQASATKAKTQLLIEKVEQRYSIAVVFATLALFAVPLLFGADLRSTLLRAMTFMIVASPCAVVLATMPPLLSAIALAGRHGVLVKSAVVMEQLADTDVVAFDKTGTLTEGHPRVVDIRAIGDARTEEVLRLAAGAEHPSEHPVGTARWPTLRWYGSATASTPARTPTSSSCNPPPPAAAPAGDRSGSAWSTTPTRATTSPPGSAPAAPAWPADPACSTCTRSPRPAASGNTSPEPRMRSSRLG